MNPYEKYQQQVVTTMTQGDMLQKLYNEVIKQMEVARVAIAASQNDAMGKAIDKAVRIIRHLRSTLDMRYEVSGNLAKLYDFFDMQLVLASVKKDVKILNEIEPLIGELRDTFLQCDKIDRSNRVASSVGSGV